jgi:hypothetical protein
MDRRPRAIPGQLNCPRRTPQHRRDRWPEAGGPLAPKTRPDELKTVYSHRWAIPRETWVRFFSSAEHEIGILAYSALFLAEDAGLLHLLADKGRQGVKVRIALGDPDSPHVAERGAEEGIGDAMAAKVRNALALYHPISEVHNVQMLLHRSVLYSSIYRADRQLLVNQHIYGIPAAHAHVLHVSKAADDDMADAFLARFGRVWAATKSIR